MKFSVFQVSRKGGRQQNEDRMGYSYTRESALFVVADGMGGHPEGDVAAQLALQAVSAKFQLEAQPVVKDPERFINGALLAAHHQIIKYAGDRGMLDTPRTTIVAVLVQNGTALWAHCGDSRLYHVRAGELLDRTRDHSYFEQAASGVIKLEAVNRNILFTCLGSPTRPIFDIRGPVPLERGDRLLLCSDGLWNSVDDNVIVAELSRRGVSDAVPELVEQALRHAGERSDNVTVLALEWETPDDFESTRGVSTDSISDGVYASTIQAGGVDPGMDDLDEEAIERSIAEINEAIKRSASRRG
jgi:PPM family protein phosphatase